jgi:hypothetical protein
MYCTVVLAGQQETFREGAQESMAAIVSPRSRKKATKIVESSFTFNKAYGFNGGFSNFSLANLFK